MPAQYGLSLQSKAAIGCIQTLLMIFNCVFWVSVDLSITDNHMSFTHYDYGWVEEI